MTNLNTCAEPLLEATDRNIDIDNPIEVYELEKLVRQVSARNGFGAPEAVMKTWTYSAVDGTNM
jgi:hypothetical protein